MRRSLYIVKVLKRCVLHHSHLSGLIAIINLGAAPYVPAITMVGSAELLRARLTGAARLSISETLALRPY